MAQTIEVAIENEMQSSYIDYAMSVIVGRALPDARDGLKPAQRRILYAMYMLGNTHSNPTKKSAKIVGEVIGHYHPHGDAAVYETLIRMAQDFSMNHMLVQGQGNMGSIDGDPPAAQRYTEVRLNKIAEEMLADLEKKAVRFVPNFDNTEEEPLVLPSKVPNLLINGSSGIAVGVAANILPHNLREVCDAIVAYVNNREITSEQLLEHIKGPDFPTGGIAFYNTGLVSSYLTGKGSIFIRGRTATEETKNRTRIIITEVPYTVNKATLVKDIADLVRNKVVTGISDLRDESGKEGIRVVIDLKQDASTDQVLNQLYKHTQLQITLPVMNVAVMEKSLLNFNIRKFIKVFVDHRVDVIRNRTKYDFDVASDRLHIVDGLLKAIGEIDEVVATIRKSNDIKEARATLIQRFTITEKQANAILDMKLSKLTSLESSSLTTEAKQLATDIANLKSILEDESKIYRIIEEETKYIREAYGRDRRTTIEEGDLSQAIEQEDLIPDEETTVLLTKNNYLKRLQTAQYRKQGRGGKGIIAIELKEGDYPKQIVYCRSKDYLLVLTNMGRAYWLKAYQVPQEGRYSSGKAAVNLIKFSEGEKAERIINTRDFGNKSLLMITKRGVIKRMDAADFSRPRQNGIRAMTLPEGDELADACLSDGSSEIFIATKAGKSLRFKETDLRQIGRTATGVRGIKLNAGDIVVNFMSAKPKDMVVSVTENGFGKATEIEKYRLQRRGGKGVLNLKVKEKSGYVVKVLKVSATDHIILINSRGLSLEFPVSSIRITGRTATGVRVMRLDEGAKVVDAQTITAAQATQESAPSQ